LAAVVAVPLLGRDMAGGIVAEWYRPDGAKVDVGEVVCRLECDFIAVEIEAEAPGVLRHRKPVGSIERPGTVLALVLAPGEAMPTEEELAGEPATEDVRPAEAESSFEPEDDGSDTEFADDGTPTAPGEPVVVPFRRRATDRQDHTESWDGVPGDSAEFDSSLFEADETAEPLAEPGAHIPGLPLWDEEDRSRRGSFAEADAEFEARYGAAESDDDAYEPDESEFRFAGLAAEAAFTAQVLTVQVRADARQVVRVREVFAREWRGFGPEPMLEDLVLMAATRALDDHRMDCGPAGLVIGDAESEVSVAIAEPLGRDVRELVAARESGGTETFERAAWVLVSLAPLGIEAVHPRLPAGMAVALGMGAVVDGRVTLTMSFDSSVLAETHAGRLLARIRSLVEEPYGLFA
jgi:pyruvate/2-oxoglutarate dehydrogenase complex dihydrolipoamide acyltransferase (E2) component